VENLAKDLGVTTKDVLEMETRLNTHDMAFDSASDANDDEADMAPAAFLEDSRYDPGIITEKEEWKKHGQGQLQLAMGKLDARSQDILQKRWLSEKKVTLQELATHYKVSAERIRQIESNAMKKLKRNIALLA
jgi:RNA polymerase sigma-32 factor